MNKRKGMILSAAVIVSAGVLCALNSGYVQIGAPVQKELEPAATQVEEMTSSAVQADEVEELRQQVEQLNAELQKAKEDTSTTAAVSENPVTSAVSTPAMPNNVVTAIAFTKSTDLTLNVGYTNKRTAATTPVGHPVTYTSSNPAVATVAADGNVTCLAAGKTIISAKSGEVSVSYNLTVTEALPVAQKTDAVKPSNTDSPLANYAVTVTDKSSLAVRSGGTDWPITTYYFIAADGTKLGSISGKAYTDIMEKYRVKSTTSSEWLAPGSGGDWVTWFADVFNEYRGLTGTGSNNSSNGTPPSSNFNSTSEANELAQLINKERAKVGLQALEVDSSTTSLAETRVQELVNSFSHTRPGGGTVADEGYAEIIHSGNSKSTASSAFQSYYNSADHRKIMLSERYNYYGVGCYKADNGKVYWAVLFYK